MEFFLDRRGDGQGAGSCSGLVTRVFKSVDAKDEGVVTSREVNKRIAFWLLIPL